MVFCNYRSNTDKDVTYAYGASPEDITGVVTFHYRDDLIEIEKAPDKEEPPARHISWLYKKHRNNFKNGIFKKKISFES